MRINHTRSVCGLKELSEISSIPIENLTFIYKRWDIRRMLLTYNELLTGGDYIKTAYIYWGDNNLRENGKDLAEYIEFHKLGKITRTEAVINPNSGNLLTIYIWTIDNVKFIEWGELNVKDPPKAKEISLRQTAFHPHY